MRDRFKEVRERGSDERKMKSEVKMSGGRCKKGREEMSGRWREANERRKAKGGKRGRKEDEGVGAKRTFNRSFIVSSTQLH